MSKNLILLGLICLFFSVNSQMRFLQEAQSEVPEENQTVTVEESSVAPSDNQEEVLPPNEESIGESSIPPLDVQNAEEIARLETEATKLTELINNLYQEQERLQDQLKENDLKGTEVYNKLWEDIQKLQAKIAQTEKRAMDKYQKIWDQSLKYQQKIDENQSLIEQYYYQMTNISEQINELRGFPETHHDEVYEDHENELTLEDVVEASS